VSGYRAGRVRPALRMVADEPDQVPRLLRFREQHPDVIIGAGEFGTWQARIPEENGESVITRYILRELLDKLDELTGASADPGGKSRDALRLGARSAGPVRGTADDTHGMPELPAVPGCGAGSASTGREDARRRRESDPARRPPRPGRPESR